jgi:hypothetical protein
MDAGAAMCVVVQVMVVPWLPVLAFPCKIWSLFSSTPQVSMGLAA